MKFKYLSFLFCLIVIFSQCTFTQDSISNDTHYAVEKPNFKSGKCYAKCLAPKTFTLESDEYVIYTGDKNSEEVDLETIEIELKPASSDWVKKKADRNCVSADPNDCLVWCLVETPAVTETVTILKDTTQSANYEVRSISKEITDQEGGFTEWREVICQGKITKSIVHQIQESLRTEGYFDGPNTISLDQETKASLTRFQKAHQLPIGNLDLETIAALNININ